MTEHFRPEGSFFIEQRRPVTEPTFGSYLRNAIMRGTLTLGGLGAVFGGGLVAKIGLEAVRDSLAKAVPVESFMPCYGKPVSGMEAKDYLTDPFGQNELIPVRSEPDSDPLNIIGWAPAGQSIRAEAEYGTHYVGGSLSSNGLGSVDCPEDSDHVYGLWFRAQEVDILVEDNNGNKILLPRFDKYIGGLNLTREFPDSSNQDQGQGVSVTSESQ